MPREPEHRPKYVLVALGRYAQPPYRFAIVNWSDKVIVDKCEDRNTGLDRVRELNGIPLKVVRKKGAPRQPDSRKVA